MARPRALSGVQDRRTSLTALLILTALASLGTGVFWNGVPFIAEHDYGFGEADTFILFVVVGIIYAVVAMRAGHVIHRLRERIAARSILATIIVAQALICLLPLFVSEVWGLWVVTILVSVLTAFLWPIVESYLSAGRGGARLRFAIGLWNVIWTASVAAALLLMAPLMRGDAATAKYAIVGLGGVNIFAALCLLWFRRVPLDPGDDIAASEVGREYTDLLHAARLLLPTSYLLVGMVSPLMPYRLETLGVEAGLKTPLTATWMIARVAAIAIMWRTPFWHGRWGTLLVGGVSMTVGFFCMVAAPSVAWMFIGLAVFGAGQGVIYYAALYYAMSVGKAAIGAAGTHEALIGVGYLGGPLLGLVPLVLVGWDRADDPAVQPTIALMRIGLVAIIMLIIALLALRHYRRAVGRRRTAGSAAEASPGAGS